ncbi:MAG: hypothetical protein EXS00_03810 [Phycisphaerales bacterium]|nr:hypothetical protein [Phycisphaerales bacterium]
MFIRTACASAICCAVSSLTSAQIVFQDQTSTRFPVQAEYTNQLSFCDIDGDGDLDIVFANGQGYSSAGAALKPRIYINDGAAVFADQTDARAAGITGWFRGVEFGDCDQDGDWDMILAQDYNKQPKLLINNGAGVFTDQSAARLPAATLSSARAQFGDTDNDGDLDIILNNSGTASRFGAGQPKLYLNNGLGIYTDGTAAGFPTGTISEQMDIIFMDADGDFDLDIHVGTRATGTNSSKLWANSGAGVFTNIVMPTDATAYSYDAGDIEGDGDLDLIGVNAGPSSAELLLRNANGLGTSWTNISTQITPNPTADDNDSRFFDYDNDGDLDLIIGALGAPERVFRNGGTGTFSQVSGIITSVSDSSLDVKVGDLNADGKLDVVTAQGESGSFQNRIYMNVGTSVDTRAPTVLRTEQVVVSGSAPSSHAVRTEVFDSHTSDRGFHDRGVFLNFTVNGGALQQVAMLWSGNNLWRGVIPAQAPAAAVSYFVTAKDWVNNLGTGGTRTYTEAGTPVNPADINGDGAVNGADLAVLLAAFSTADAAADIDGNGVVDGIDLAILLASFGT